MIVAPDQPRILHLTFKITEAFLDHGRADLAGRKRCQSKAAKFVDVPARTVGDPHHLLGEAVRRDCNHGSSR